MEQTSPELIHDLNFKVAVAAYVKLLRQAAVLLAVSHSLQCQCTKLCNFTMIFPYSGNVDYSKIIEHHKNLVHFTALNFTVLRKTYTCSQNNKNIQPFTQLGHIPDITYYLE